MDSKAAAACPRRLTYLVFFAPQTANSQNYIPNANDHISWYHYQIYPIILKSFSKLYSYIIIHDLYPWYSWYHHSIPQDLCPIFSSFKTPVASRSTCPRTSSGWRWPWEVSSPLPLAAAGGMNIEQKETAAHWKWLLHMLVYVYIYRYIHVYTYMSVDIWV